MDPPRGILATDPIGNHRQSGGHDGGEVGVGLGAGAGATVGVIVVAVAGIGGGGVHAMIIVMVVGVAQGVVDRGVGGG